MDEKVKSSTGRLKKNEVDTTSPFADLDAIFGKALAGTFEKIGQAGVGGPETDDLKERIEGRIRKNRRSVVDWPSKLRKFFRGTLEWSKRGFTTPSKFHPDAALKRREEKTVPRGRKLTVFVDTSGSVFGTPGVLQQFIAEVSKIAGGENSFKYYDIVPFNDTIDFGAALIERARSEIRNKNWTLSNLTSGGTVYDCVYNFIYNYYIDHKDKEDNEYNDDAHKVKINHKPNCILIVSDSDVLADFNKFSVWAKQAENKEKGEKIAKAYARKVFFMGLYPAQWASLGDMSWEDAFKEACIPGTKVLPVPYEDFLKYLDLDSNTDEDTNENYIINNKMDAKYFKIDEAFKKKAGGTRPAAMPGNPIDPTDPNGPDGPDSSDDAPEEQPENQPVQGSHSDLFNRVRGVSKGAASGLMDNAFVEDVDEWIKEVLVPAWGLTKVPSESQCRNLPQTYAVDADGNVVINNQLLGMGRRETDDRHAGRKMMFSRNTFPKKAFSEKYINNPIVIKKYVGSLTIDGFTGTQLPGFIPKQIRCGESGGELIITNCPNLNSIVNMPVYVDRRVSISNTDLTLQDVRDYKKIIRDSWTEFRTKNSLSLDNPPKVIANDIFENKNNKMDRKEYLVESRRRLARRYSMQSSPIMTVNETFGHLDKENPDYDSIPLELNKIAKMPNNKPIIRELTSKVKAPWGYLTSNMVDVYDKPEDYHLITKLIQGAKKIAADGQFGIMIFTDSEDNITYINTGTGSTTNSLYIDNDIKNTMNVRVDMMKSIKNTLDAYGIDPNTFPNDKNIVTLDEFCGKIVYNAIVKYKNDTTTPLAQDSIFNIDTFDDCTTYKDICDLIRRDISRVSYGRKYWNTAQKKFSSFTQDVAYALNSKGEPNSTDSLQFKRIISTYGPQLKYKMETILNPELLAVIIKAVNIRDIKDAGPFDGTLVKNVYSNTSGTYPLYKESVLDNMSASEMYDIYDDLRNVNVINSILYNTSVKIDESKKGAVGNSFSRFEQLLLFPDKVSRLYWIKNEPMNIKRRKGSDDAFIEPVDTRNVTDLEDDAAKAAAFGSEETVDKFRQGFYTRGQEPNQDYRGAESKQHRIWRELDRDNNEIYGDLADEVRGRAQSGLYATKKERNNYIARERREQWNELYGGNTKYSATSAKFDRDRRTSGIIDVEDPVAYAHAVKGDIDFVDTYNQFVRNFNSFTSKTKSGKMSCQARFDNLIKIGEDAPGFKQGIVVKYFSAIYDLVMHLSKQNFKYHAQDKESQLKALLAATNVILGSYDSNSNYVSWYQDDCANLQDAIEDNDGNGIRDALESMSEHTKAIINMCNTYKLNVYHYSRGSVFEI